MSAMPVGMELGIRAKVGEYFPSLYMKRAIYMHTVLNCTSVSRRPIQFAKAARAAQG